jgi:hypothetical protein
MGKPTLSRDLVSLCWLTLGLLPGLGTACSVEPEPRDEATASAPIRSPVSTAAAYPEAALIDFNGSACSGAVIAPRVVLTAGHCVMSAGPWKVTTPYARGADGRAQVRTGYRRWTRYQSTGQSVNPNTPDVGLILMDAGQAFSLPAWPKVQRSQVADGTQAFNIGRKNNGALSWTDLFVGRTLSLRRSGYFPTSYETSEIIEPGDSGGPVMLANTHTIAAVNSGAGGGSQVLARTDAVIGDIDAQVAANGGWPSGSGSGGGTGTTCTDSNQHCQYWASVGECSKNPNYMLTNCCSSCRSTGSACLDKNQYCRYWASVGECSRNPAYMLPYCCASCSGR